MSMKFTRLLFAALLTIAGTTQAAEQPLTLYFKAGITIAPDGTLSRVDWHDAAAMPAAVRQRLDSTVRAWEFVPGTIDGRPAETETWLRMRLRAEPSATGLALFVEEARTGAQLTRAVPAYPKTALRTMDEAAVLARIELAADGSRTVHVEEFVGDEHHRKAFTDAVERMAAKGQVAQELVGGLPAPATFTIPVTFCINSGCGDEIDAFSKRVASDPAGRPGAALPVDSVARLVTDVRGKAI